MTRHIPDVVLERYRLNELPERSARTVEEMMAADPGVRERLEALAASDAEIQRQYPSSRFVRDVAAPPRRLVISLVTAAALGVAALILAVALPHAPLQPAGTERVKGTVGGRPSLALYRRTDTGSERLADGDVARPGDLLRVGYASAGRPYGLILSIDGRGTVTLHLPPAGNRAVQLTPGKTILLDAAYELDDAPRIERFYFVTGKEPFAAEPLVSAAREAARQGSVPDTLPLPAGLEQVTVAVQKEARK